MPAPKEFYDEVFANRLTIFREKYIHKSQNQARKMLGIPQSTLSYMENKRMAIRYDFISRLAKEYGLNPEWFATGKGNPVETNSKKKTLVTDINQLNDEITLLKNYIKKMELNQAHFITIVERLEAKLEGKV
jgi:plasmid maintenance system antidote protein VapI